MDLLSLVLTLRPATTAALSPRLGRAAHAILLARLARLDPTLADAIHNMDGPKPLTCSDVLGAREAVQVLPEQAYTLRYTALTAEVAAALAKAFAVGDTLTFEGTDFTVEALDDGQGDESSPWAGSDTYQALAGRYLIPGSPAARNAWGLLFAAPTAFKVQGKTLPLPLPGLVFGSLVTRWNAFAPVALPAEGVRQYAEEMVVISRFALRSAPGWDRGQGDERGLRIGAIGKVTYRAQNHDRYWCAALSLLAEFARYAGVGIVTTMGMGQARAL